MDATTGKGKGKDKGEEGGMGRRRKVDHWVPAIWIPDEKTSACMRCGRPFGWRRRRHHCRLCGRCVCAACSGQASGLVILLDVGSLTFLITADLLHFRPGCER